MAAAVIAWYGISRLVWAIQNWNNADWEWVPQLELYLEIFFVLPIAASILGLAVVAVRGTGWWATASLAAGGLVALGIGTWLRGNHADGHQVFLLLGAIALILTAPRAAEQAGQWIRSRAHP